jgi:hypothetical protein
MIFETGQSILNQIEKNDWILISRDIDSNIFAP